MQRVMAEAQQVEEQVARWQRELERWQARLVEVEREVPLLCACALSACATSYRSNYILIYTGCCSGGRNKVKGECRPDHARTREAAGELAGGDPQMSSGMGSK